jgi:hypothetical protein
MMSISRERAWESCRADYVVVILPDVQKMNRRIAGIPSQFEQVVIATRKSSSRALQGRGDPETLFLLFDPARMNLNAVRAEPVEVQESIHISTSPMRTDSWIKRGGSIGRSD